MSGSPTSKYQCVSRPGKCKFEWTCGPCCACHVPSSPKSKANEAEAERRQARWRAKDAVTKLGNVVSPP